MRSLVFRMMLITAITNAAILGAYYAAQAAGAGEMLAQGVAAVVSVVMCGLMPRLAPWMVRG